MKASTVDAEIASAGSSFHSPMVDGKKCKILNAREIFALLLCEDYLWCDMKNKTLKTEEMFNTQLIFVLFAGN